jgi:glycosyltransferase involved in cell wall biosynthesis
VTGDKHTTPNVSRSGKFFALSGQKFFFKAMPLESVDDSPDFDQKLALRKRFTELKRAHTTGLILGERQAEHLLDLVAQAGLHAMVKIEARPEYLLDRRQFHAMLARVLKTARTLRSYPALMGYLIDCEIEPAALRYHGLDLLKRRLRKLIRAIHEVDDSKIAGLKHRPSTVGLSLLDEDLIYAEMPALTPIELKDYVIRLHNLAEARPVVLEFGEELPGQDELVACAFGLGAAGVVAPAMRPAVSSGTLGIRMLSAGELLPFITLNGSCPPKPAETPMVSVVICAYNAERTMRSCLESLRKIDYPNFEVVIVDDGSRDHTADISMEFPEFRLIRQPNKGLSVARNVGMQAARGELIAYTDSDCVVDPDWLTLIVRSMGEGRFDGCGGPNYAPHEDELVAGCVAASPGAPCPVLTADDRAEHLAGCNMVFRKAALLAIGGFDPQFTAAGDDVDICWRMLDAGYSLGFCPAAFVWHFRRNTVKAYYGQQRGYGRAEAMLFMKYPDRFNTLGQIKWRGTIPGLARTIPGGARRRVAWVRRRSDFQHVHDEQLSVLKVLPVTVEWNALALIALVAAYGAHVTLIPPLVMLALGPLWALFYAARASIEKCHDGVRARLFVAALAYTGPVSRTLERYRWRKAARQKRLPESLPRQRPTLEWYARTMRLAYWNETWTTREKILERLTTLFGRVGHPAAASGAYDDFDLLVESGRATRLEIRSADEEHEGGRLKNHLAVRVRLTRVARVALAATTVGALVATVWGLTTLAFVLGAVTFATAMCAASEAIEKTRLAYRAIEQCATELGLTPLGAPTRASRNRVSTPVVVAPETQESVQPAGR